MSLKVMKSDLSSFLGISSI
jgi:hypothetical protein